ncbi:MAG: 2-phospho-L-lactate guanylyltransferase [Anaerolineae bacterium]|nr:2-phospho-L-lactate guanylyltransferase [Anaerolineae bacterium]
MYVWAIIPVKPLNRAKSRLADVLSPEQRQELAEGMFRHVLDVVQHVPQVIGTLVVSRDSKALSIARDYNAKTVQESGQPELNTALTRATQVVMNWNCNAVLVLPADLPLISRNDVSDIIELGSELLSVVLATDQDGDGTNALFMRPPGFIEYAFGPGSFSRHTQLAREAGIEPKIYHSARLALDIDLPSDLDTYQHSVRGLDLDYER